MKSKIMVKLIAPLMIKKSIREPISVGESLAVTLRVLGDY